MNRNLLPLAFSLLATSFTATATASTLPQNPGVLTTDPLTVSSPALDTLHQQLTQGPVMINLAGQWFVLWKLSDRAATVSPSLQSPLTLYSLPEFLHLWSQGGQFSKVMDLRS